MSARNLPALVPKVAPLLGFLVGEQGLQGHVEADHGGRGAGAEQVVGGFRILRDVASIHALQLPGTVSAPPMSTIWPISSLISGAFFSAASMLVIGPVGT